LTQSHCCALLFISDLHCHFNYQEILLAKLVRVLHKSFLVHGVSQLSANCNTLVLRRYVSLASSSRYVSALFIALSPAAMAASPT
jgi:hypothetical protein